MYKKLPRKGSFVDCKKREISIKCLYQLVIGKVNKID